MRAPEDRVGKKNLAHNFPE